MKICRENSNLVKIWHFMWRVTNNLSLLGNKIAPKALLSITRNPSMQHISIVAFPVKCQYLLDC